MAIDNLVVRLLLALALLCGAIAVVNRDIAAAVVTAGLLIAWAIVMAARLRNGTSAG